jgi:two-component system NtrC family sensor kinase
MKKIFVLIIMLAFTMGTGLAQNRQADSLKRLLNKSHADSAKLELLVELSRVYYLQQPDSGLSYASQALAISKKTGNKKGEMHALTQVGFSLIHLSNWPIALQTFIRSLRMAEQLNDNWSIARNYDGMSVLYTLQGEDKLAIAYASKAEAIFSQLHDYKNVVDESMDLGEFYFTSGKLDSSLIAGNKALQMSVRTGDTVWRARILSNIGNVYAKLNNLKLALAYQYKSIAIVLKHNETFNLISTYFNLATIYHDYGKRDSSIFYAKKTFDIAQKGSFGLQMSQASALLAQLYYGNNDHEAARYYKITKAIQDSLFNAEKTKQVFIINIAEQQHEADLKNAAIDYQNKLKLYGVLTALLVVMILMLILWNNNKKQQKANELLESQKKRIQEALHNLKLTQNQLIQSEKMASLGELTAGIAHEIQNPLNFVNNFSEVNREMIGELKGELKKGDVAEAMAIADDIEQNEVKINHHGKRADSIVKGMLEHSRISTGEKQETNINILADEFLKLSYHGLRAKDKNFNAELVTHFDKSLPEVNVAQQDIGRVLLNLFNNAFYAVNQKQKTAGPGYKPEVTVSTFAEKGNLVIKVKDNGNGIPDAIRDKIMQPFFTTKPTGEGTGLGLSLAYDIVKAHGGELKAGTNEGEGAEFIIQISTNKTL